MLSGVIMLAAGLLLGGLTCWLLFMISSRLVWGVGLMLMVFIIATLLSDSPLQVGINVNPEDAVFLLVALASILRLSQISRLNDVSFAWLLYGLLLFFSFYQGITLFGTKAGVDFRSTFYYWVAVTYVMTFQATQKNQNTVGILWGVTAIGLLMIALYHQRLT